MCKAFSCLITKSKRVYWEAGLDSHSDIIKLFLKKDKELKDDKDPPYNTFASIEITPENRNYLKPDKWIFKVDMERRPEWFSPKHEELCWAEFNKWKKQVYSLLDLKQILNPTHPFKIKPPKINKKHLKVLLHWVSVRDSVRASVWASVWDSVGASVWDSVWYSVRASVWDSVRDSVWASVWDSVRASVGAYIGSMVKLKKWEYVKFKHKGYPFADAVKLWDMGLVSSFDGNILRLHGGKRANVLWEGTKKDLIEQCK